MILRKIGVDFGTSTSVVAYMDFKDGKPMNATPNLVLFDQETTPYTPTLILCAGTVKGKTTDEKYGWEAQKATPFYSLLKRNFKMDLLSQNENKRLEAEQLTSKFYCELYRAYRQCAINLKNQTPNKIITYISYPAKFLGDIPKFLASAAADAGFPNVELIYEASAAMQCVLETDTDGEQKNLFKSFEKSMRLMLIDMGAGTSDIAIYDYDLSGNEEHKLLGYYPKSGEIDFGGREIDEILCAYYLKKLGNQVFNFLGNGDIEFGRQILLKEVKNFKETDISPELNNNNIITTFPQSLTYIANNSDIEFDRTNFEVLINDYLPQFSTLVNGALNESNVSGSDIDLVVLTGGHSQWYFVKDMLKGIGSSIYLPKIQQESWRIINFAAPHMVVARGATLLKPKSAEVKKPVSRSSISHPRTTKIENNTPKQAKIIIKSDFFPVGCLRKVIVRIDSNLFKLGCNESHTLHVAPGVHSINISNKALFSDASVDYDEENSLEFNLNAGDEIIFDLTKLSIGKFNLYRNGVKIV